MIHQESSETRKKVLGYVRVSTLEQAKEGFSLDLQRRKLKSFCELHDLELLDVFEDQGFSGKGVNQPGLQELFEALSDDGIDGVVVYRLDRLTRSTRDLLVMIDETFVKNKVDFFSVTEKVDTTTAMGRFFLTIIGALAQMERELVGEWTAAGMEKARLRGSHLGGVPLGFKRNRKKALIPDKGEQAVMKRIRELHEEGKSLRSIAATLREEKHQTKKGGEWHPQTVKLILDRIKTEL